MQQFFRNNPPLETLNAESYTGVPWFDSHHLAIGNLCMIDVKPPQIDKRTKAIMSVFAALGLPNCNANGPGKKRRAYEQLKFRVEERTAEWIGANLALETEIKERIAV